MTSNDYQYFHFPKLSIDLAFSGIECPKPDICLHAYKVWVISFVHRAELFYHVQFLNHQTFTEKLFRQLHNLDEHDSFSEYGDWEGFWETQLGVHNNLWEQKQKELDLWSKKYNRETDSLYSMSKIVEILVAEAPLTPFLKQFDEIWFNCSINNSLEKQQVLKDLPYNEYLRTTHWRRVRAAMLLICQARCQTLGCLNSYEGSWNGWESDLHVHHKTYVNRGNERYKDLILLCKDCHLQAHA